MSAAVSRRRVLKLAGGAAAVALTAVAGEYGLRATEAEAKGSPRATATPGATAGRPTARRVAAWAAAPAPPDAGTPSAAGLHNAELRMVVRPTVGGSRPRIRLSNRYGTAPLRVAGAWVAPRDHGPYEQPGTAAVVTFGGARTVVIPPGHDLVSDPVPTRAPVEARTALLVGLAVAGATGPATWHPRSRDVTYLLDRPAPKPHKGHRSVRAPRWTQVTGWYWLSGLDVLSEQAVGTVVCFGDSITDGPATAAARTTVRWPDLLADRIAVERPRAPYGVVDLGIAGNRLLSDTRSGGVSALQRFDQDALGQPGATDVILLEGINDIGGGSGPDGRPVTAQELIAGQRTLIARARRAGLAVHGCTLLPFRGTRIFSPERDQVRVELNSWIRNGREFDSVLDFERAVQDPDDPTRLAPAYDSGDHLHPSDTGHAVLAGAVDITALAALRR